MNQKPINQNPLKKHLSDLLFEEIKNDKNLIINLDMYTGKSYHEIESLFPNGIKTLNNKYTLYEVCMSDNECYTFNFYNGLCTEAFQFIDDGNERSINKDLIKLLEYVDINDFTTLLKPAGNFIPAAS